MARLGSVIALVSACVGCAGAEGDAEPTGLLQASIYGGVPDTGRAAVMALLPVEAVRASQDTTGACTATVVATQGTTGASGLLLTAAHCVAAHDGERMQLPVSAVAPSSLGLLPDADWIESWDLSRIYPVVEIAIHPAYDGSVHSPFDVAVARFVGADATTAALPLLMPEEDELSVGTPLIAVGYGSTETSDGNSERRAVERSVSSLTASQLLVDQSDGKGTCSGDSGGPLVVETARGPRLAGVTSYGDVACTAFGAATRVSSIASFVRNAATALPATLDCSECRLAAIAPDQRCAQARTECDNAFTDCGRHRACLAQCEDAACRTACEASEPAGAAAADALLACQCASPCADSCGGTEACLADAAATDDDAHVPQLAAASCALAPMNSAPQSLRFAPLALALALIAWRRRRCAPAPPHAPPHAPAPRARANSARSRSRPHSFTD